MPEWKLHTTQEDDLAGLVKAVREGTRKFIWLHVSSEEERNDRVDMLQREGLTVLPYVPIWFVVACAPETPRRDQLRMCYSILVGAQVDEAQWRGEMFGYSQEEIDWYIAEVDAAWARYCGWAGKGRGRLMKYTVCKRMRFAAAHRLRDYPGKCADLHGHNYTVEVFMRAPRLNELGMVVDFVVLKNLVGGWLDKNWDHATILHELDSVPGVSRVYTLTDNPTAEVMAESLFEMLEGCFPLGINDVVVHRVRVWETEDSFAEVEGHE